MYTGARHKRCMGAVCVFDAEWLPHTGRIVWGLHPPPHLCELSGIERAHASTHSRGCDRVGARVWRHLAESCCFVLGRRYIDVPTPQTLKEKHILTEKDTDITFMHPVAEADEVHMNGGPPNNTEHDDETIGLKVNAFADGQAPWGPL